MKQIALFALINLVLAACSTEGVKKESLNAAPKKKTETTEKRKVIATKELPDGIVVRWFKKGKGEQIIDGDLLLIDYKVTLKNGNAFDGNYLLKRPYLPYMVGYRQQTPGWDIALHEMRVGDEAEIFIPSELARGKKGIKGIVPPNADNVLIIRILENKKPTRVIDGTKVWLVEENKSNKLKFNEQTAITMHVIGSTTDEREFVNTIRMDKPYTMRLSDYGVVPGLKKALINAKKADRLYILVPAEEAYGNSGYLNLVKPGQAVFYSVIVLDVTK